MRTSTLLLSAAALSGMVPGSCAVRAFAAQDDVPAPPNPILEEVIVTAQKRSENLQHAAAAITAIAGKEMVAAGITDIRGAQNFVPSVRFQAENASTEIYVRGVGSTLDLPNIEPPTSFNMNGIYVPREATSVAAFDIAQLEVLPGPQGTLYGRSSLGGAVHVTAQRPTSELESIALLEGGSDNLFHGGFVQNLPVSERFAWRGAFDYLQRDGVQKTGADSHDDYSARLSGLYEPNDALSVLVWTQGTKKQGRSPNLVRKGFNGGTFDGDPHAFDTSDAWNDVITPDAPTAAEQDYENLIVAAQVDYTLGDTTFSYLPSYLYLDWAGNYWLENLPSFLSAHYNQVTQELRASGRFGAKWHWLSGVYGYQVTNDGQFIVAGFPLANVSRNRLEGVAAFGEATRDLGQAARLTLGARYSADHREGDGLTAFGQSYAADESFDHLDWKIGLEIDVPSDSMLYATVQTGYQPGTYNLFPSTAANDNLVEPAKLTAYTLGAKSRFADGRLQINNELFYYDYRDLFVQSFNLNTALLTTFNAEAVEIYGDQLDVRWNASQGTQLSLSIGYLHARNEKFVVPDGVDIGPGPRDFAGYSLQYAPDLTVTAGLQHDFNVGAGYLRARIHARYESEFWGTFNHARATQQQAYTKSDASITYFAADERWSAGLWIRNMENEPVLAATTTGQFGPYADAFLEPPRTYGVRITLAL